LIALLALDDATVGIDVEKTARFEWLGGCCKGILWIAGDYLVSLRFFVLIELLVPRFLLFHLLFSFLV
jgi:hypothetical protein